LRENFAQLAVEAEQVVGLKSNDLVVDIGSNDGTLLENFQKAGKRVCGIEPTQAGKIARKKKIPTIEAFFSPVSARQVVRKYGHARIVTATNVFAHMENIHELTEAVLLMLDRDGIFITESHYLLPLLETLQYDTIYHEHLRYYSLHSLRYLLEQHGLELIHARPISTHGGSIRVYAARKGSRKVQDSVGRILRLEKSKLHEAAFGEFRRKVSQSKLDLMAQLRNIRGQGKRIYGVGAPSRASTLVNYVGLDDQIIDCVLEIRGSYKIGKYMPGTMIPVVDEARLFDDPPDYALLFSWHIADELMDKLWKKGYRGKFIVPLPKVKIFSPES